MFSCRRRFINVETPVRYLSKWRKFTKYLRLTRVATQIAARRWSDISEILLRRESFSSALEEDLESGEVTFTLLQYILHRQSPYFLREDDFDFEQDAGNERFQ